LHWFGLSQRLESRVRSGRDPAQPGGDDEDREGTPMTDRLSGSEEKATASAGRRDFMKGSVAVGAGLAGLGALSLDENRRATLSRLFGVSEAKAASAQGGLSMEVPPGKLDDYYGFWSGGQSGEIRILGVPSMREIKRIPVFNRDAATGWGRDDYSARMLGGLESGDTHHVHLSYTDGTYDGRYVYVNDKANARLARVSCENMEVDAIVDIPNAQGTHGIFPQRNKTGLVLCNSEFRTPQPNDGRDLDDPKAYGAMHTAIDGETMQVKWQVLVEGNMDLCATDYEGKYSFATCYNSEAGVNLEGMMAAERDWLYVFNISAIKKAVKAGKTIEIGQSKVPVVDARGKNGPFVQRIPIPKSPHGVNIDPTGRYAMCCGKLSPTVSVVDLRKLDAVFAGKIKPRDAVVAEPEVGLGPLHTAFDNRGNAYTSIFIDSVITKWNIQKAIDAYAGQDVDPIVQKIDVHYQVGHTNASMSETKEADGKWLIALCKFSKDRFLNVGPLHHENDQLIDISGEQMRLVHDGPAYPEPHDCVLVRRDLIRPEKIVQRKGPRYDFYEAMAKEDGVDLLTASKVIRKGKKKVRAYIVSAAPAFSLTEIRVKSGDQVQVVMTNLDGIEDLSHGFCVSLHDVNMGVNPRGTNSITFTAGEPGIYWYYCTWFCHALHLEMRGRLIVEA
jgi:nitrous-oxide reductase